MDEALLWKSNMTVVYAQQELPTTVTKTLFLAGPTPRNAATPSWRPEALEILSDLGFDGHVLVPEPQDGKWLSNYDAQIEWEERALHMADVIVFWVPREIPSMMALTTNIEWGAWANSGKVVWGAPEEAVHTRYPEYYANKLGILHTKTLKHTLRLALEHHLGQGALRQGGECQVPLMIWRKKEFQGWLKRQKDAGNRLDGARVLWTFLPKPGFILSYALKVNIHVASENRNKTNEITVTRPDVSSVVLYQKQNELVADFLDTKIVLVREFRSSVRNSEAFVYELPGGSSVNELDNALGVAASEVKEETGLELDYKRFRRHEARQLVATFSTHTNSLFSCELTPEEMRQLEADKEPHGNFIADSEMTFVEVKTVREILSDNLVDWSTLGCIFAVLHREP